jgi:excisionase family DNA binding protein
MGLPMLSVAQAAARLGISRSKAYELKTRIPHYKIGGKILFDERDLDTFKESCRVLPEEQSSSRAFTQLRPDRLAAAWKKQGAL